MKRWPLVQNQNQGILVLVGTGYSEPDASVGPWDMGRRQTVADIRYAEGNSSVAYVYGETLNDERFKENVGRNSAKTISRTAKDRRAGTLGYAEALVMAYNAKSKYRLPIKTLYWNGWKRDEEPEEYEEYEEET